MKASAKSHIRANIFIAMNSGGIGEYVRHNNYGPATTLLASYVKLNPNTSAASLEAKLPAFLNKYGRSN